MDTRTYPGAASASQVMVNTFIRSVYGWMAFALALTGVVAMGVANTQAAKDLLMANPGLLFIPWIAAFIMVMVLSARVSKMSAQAVTTTFVVYAGLMGVALASVFWVYTADSIARVFFICSGTFGACSIYGYVTKRDLTSLGGFLFMGLIGIIIASVVNIFLRSEMIFWVVSYLGVGIFMGLTAYDTQKIKNMALTMPHDVTAGTIRKGAIMGALSLYLDFINLFLFLLRIFGVARD